MSFSGNASKKIMKSYMNELRFRAKVCERFYQEQNYKALLSECYTIRILAQALHLEELEHALIILEKGFQKGASDIEAQKFKTVIGFCSKMADDIEGQIEKEEILPWETLSKLKPTG
jgi:hypothetical protein